MKERVLVDRLWTIGPAVAAHVWGYGMEPGLGERRQLVPPGVPGFGKTVAQDDQGTRPLFGHVHAYAVCLDGTVTDLGHRRSPFPADHLDRILAGPRSPK
jgi:hypothetical protein